MGKPRLIIVIRHAQSEGNKNRAIHQTVPDHRVKLTQEGWTQAEEAGHRLRALLKRDDTLQFFTSPYRRTRETTEGILKTLTSDDPEPSPFSRQSIKVWEEPRLREQDFGNFQPCSAAMERMWQERADYGHFFYRIPNGESAADAYDRVSGFNESLWRSFQEDDFPSVCVLVTHGLMSRVFLMKWYHWSVEYFEDLRNVNHCEFIVMNRTSESGKFILETQLRTWSELKRRAAAQAEAEGKTTERQSSSPVPKKRWGGCPDGCTHEKDDYPKLFRRQDTKSIGLNSAQHDQASASKASSSKRDFAQPSSRQLAEEDEEAFPRQTSTSASLVTQTNGKEATASSLPERLRDTTLSIPGYLKPSFLDRGRDFGGSASGLNTPSEAEGHQESSDYGFSYGRGDMRDPAYEDSSKEAEWMEQSGMGKGARADALGDQSEDEGEIELFDEQKKLEAEEAKDKSLRGSVY